MRAYSDILNELESNAVFQDDNFQDDDPYAEYEDMNLDEWENHLSQREDRDAESSAQEWDAIRQMGYGGK